jgi:hypothetical protein
MAGVATLGIYTFLIKENPIYRFFEHLFIGIAAGFLPILTIKNMLWPKILEPMFGGSTVIFPDGSVYQPYESIYLIYLIPIAIGLFYYTIYLPKLSWLSRIVIGISLGFSAGLEFKGFFAEMIPQLSSSLKPLLVFSLGGEFLWKDSLSNCVFIATLTLVMWYFIFSIKRGGAATLNLNKAARWLMMICFGAFFGSTVMARMALLVERVNFLTNDWYQSLLALL